MTSLRPILGHLNYLAVQVLLVLAIPPGALRPVSDGLIVVGVLGTWRYGWAMINYLRAVFYQRIAYPRLKS